MKKNNSRITTIMVYERIVNLEAKVDNIGKTKLETLKEVRIGIIALLILSLLNLAIHYYELLLG